jgi:hypothetical protein
MVNIDIIFVDTTGFQNELDDKFGKGVFTVCVNRQHDVKTKFVTYDETITENSEINTVIPGCGGHNTIETIKFVCVTETMINEVINMSNIHNKNLLEDQKKRLSHILESCYIRLMEKYLPNEKEFTEIYNDLSEWSLDKSQPYPLYLQIYAKENEISCEEAIVVIQDTKIKMQNYITTVKNVKLQGKFELLDIEEYVEYKLKFTDVINRMQNIVY